MVHSNINTDILILSDISHRRFSAGDIKLFSVIAGFLTLKTWWVCVEAAFLVGAAMGLFKLLFKNYVKDAHTIHFSVPILAGYLYYLGVVR